MTSDIINGLVGLLVGLLSGYVFERRATNAARAHSRELERELEEIRHSVLSVGGSVRTASPVQHDEGLVDSVRARAVAVQDSEGRVARSSLITFFLAHGHSGDDIDRALEQLCLSGEAREDGAWLVLR